MKNLGPVVRRPIANPGLNFNPFFFLLFKSIFSDNFSLVVLEHPITKLQTKGIKLNLLF